MEILKISDNKLKVMLTEADMKKYSLKACELDYNDSVNRRKFWGILDDIKSLCGFNVEGDKVLIQFYPSKDGGCEMFITKLGVLSRAAEKNISRSDRLTMLSSLRVLYKFYSLENLAAACGLLNDEDCPSSSDLFFGEGGELYLEITERGSASSAGLSSYERLLEFSERVDKALYPYITEHCKRITKGNAVEVICKAREGRTE